MTTTILTAVVLVAVFSSLLQAAGPDIQSLALIPTQPSILYSDIGKDGAVFSSSLLSTVTAKSELGCARMCTGCRSCLTLTFMKGAQSENCRLHGTLLTEADDYTITEGTTSYSNTAAFLQTGLTNVALNKPAEQSTHFREFIHPENAVDGNRDTNIAQCFHTDVTDGTPNRWWRVDLLDLYEIHFVILTNRGDCCGDRLANFDIDVSTDPFDPFQSSQNPSLLCFHREEAVGTGATVRLNCSQPITGRYVTLVLHSDKWALHFCEMEVMGKPVSGGRYC